MGIRSKSLGNFVETMKTLVIGLGNPILGDDGVGWKIAEEVKAALGQQPHVEVDTAALGGLSLMERMLGYERVILVDAMETGRHPVGSVHKFPLASLQDPMAGHSSSAHDTSLSTALETAKHLRAEIPQYVHVVAIEARCVYDFGEILSPPVAAAVPFAVQSVLDLIQGVPYDLS